MYTVEDIKNITFTKTLGGYKTNEVDDFIDMCAATVEALTAEKEDLKKKMELLANKVVEYRNDEDSIRTALLSAQRMGDTVLREANHKAGLILEDAKIKAEKVEETAKQEITAQLRELENMKKMVGEFKSKLLSVYREHLSLIDVLPDYKGEEKAQQSAPAKEQAPVEAVEEEPVAEQTEQPVEAEQPQEVEPSVVEPAQESLQEEMTEEEPAVDMPLFTVDEPQDDNARVSGLKFGVDYDMAADDDDDEAEETAGKKRHKRRLF